MSAITWPLAAGRWPLAEAAWRIVYLRSERTATLRAWPPASRRRGKCVPVVALARRLVGILYAMWRDGAAYDGGRSARRVSGRRRLPNEEERVGSR